MSGLGLLIRHEARLVWRASLFGGRRGPAWLIGLLLLTHLLGYGVATGLARLQFAPSERVFTATLLLLFVGGLMLSQAVQRASELLDDRTDLGWLLSTPLPPHTILAMRLLAVTGSVMLYWVVLLIPLANGMALRGRPELLGIYLVLPAFCLILTSCGFILTFGLLRWTSVTRTRALANALATLIGAAIFLSGQLRTLLPGGRAEAFWRHLAPSPHSAQHSLVWLPGRALLGSSASLAILVATALCFAVVTCWGLQRWFASGAQAVVAGETGAGRARRWDGRAFNASPWPALVGKELLLLRRYPGLTGLTAYYLVYLVPAVAAISHGASSGDLRAFGVAPVLSAGELARLFISVTVMGDAAAELVQTAPVARRTAEAAKLAVAGLAVCIILALPVAGLGASVPSAILPMLAGITGNVGCNLLLGLWRPAPIRR